MRKASDSNWLTPKGEFSERLEQTFDLSKEVSEQGKRGSGNSPYTFDKIGVGHAAAECSLYAIYLALGHDSS